MYPLFRKVYSTAVVVPLLAGVVGVATGATAGVSWTRPEVVPVVLVRPGIGGFEPVEGISIGTRWSKTDVKAVVLVKPGIGGFEPHEGISIGNMWRKDEILPVMLVEPFASSFVPLQALATGSGSATGLNLPQGKSSPLDSPSLIESYIDGDFSGWEGETVVRLRNGQIWQQTEYFYHYHYAFMPKVLIFRSGVGYKMKVDGVERAVGVKRLK